MPAKKPPQRRSTLIACDSSKRRPASQHSRHKLAAVSKARDPILEKGPAEHQPGSLQQSHMVPQTHLRVKHLILKDCNHG
jgi:hypothetical protein